MSTRQTLIDDTTDLLWQGIELLKDLDDALYAKPEPAVASSGIGSHFRHLIDYYECFLAGLPEGCVDYDRRAREEVLEQKTARAKARLRTLTSTLMLLTESEQPDALSIKMDYPVKGTNAPHSRSSIERELQFLMSHTVHHFALIAVILRLNGRSVRAGFGVAPSTLQHREATHKCAP